MMATTRGKIQKIFTELEQNSFSTRIVKCGEDKLCPKQCNKDCSLTLKTILKDMGINTSYQDEWETRAALITAFGDDNTYCIEIFINNKEIDTEQLQKDICEPFKREGLLHCINTHTGHLMMSIGGTSCSSIVVFSNKKDHNAFLKNHQKK